MPLQSSVAYVIMVASLSAHSYVAENVEDPLDVSLHVSNETTPAEPERHPKAGKILRRRDTSTEILLQRIAGGLVHLRSLRFTKIYIQTCFTSMRST